MLPAPADAAKTALAPGLYIVATPIGNLGDLTDRARMVLANADLIAAEDTRQTAKLLAHIGARTPMTPYHDHNADVVRPRLLERARAAAVALVSDAGTPLISDPGFKLVRDARDAGIAVTTLPGPCAAIAALTLAGLPTDRFLFLGFLPPKRAARRAALAEVARVQATLVAYEAPSRLAATLADACAVLGDRKAAVTRELSKRFEEVLDGSLEALAGRIAAHPVKGEVVVVIAPPAPDAPMAAGQLQAALAEALERQPLKSAVAEVAALLGLSRKQVYDAALALKAGR